MGNRQKRFGKTKHRNYKNAIQQRLNIAKSEKRKVPESTQSTADERLSADENIQQLDEVQFGNCFEEGITDDVQEIYIDEGLICNDEDDVEETITHDEPYGRRLVEIQPFFEAIRRLNSHNPTNTCNFSNMQFVKEFRHGLNSTFTFTCKECNYTGVIVSNPTVKQQLEVNYASVLGAYAVGTGFYQCQEFFGTLEVPFMAVATYDKRQKLVQSDLKKCAEKVKKEAMEEEKRIAIERNEVDSNGIPLISGLIDGSWPKRSYRTHYDSLSGTACIIGLHTKKVIWHGVKNKYCRICALSKGETKEHDCKRNYVGPSTGMESQLILEAFRNSEKDYGIRYHKFIADGDCKTYKVIDEAKIYRNPTLKIEKIECVLHLYRCARGRLYKVKGLIDSKVERLVVAIQCSTKHWSESDLSTSEKIENIRKDILNAPHHIFGDHAKCHEYYCDKEKHTSDVNGIPQMKRNGMYNNIMHALGRLVENAKSLLCGLNTNFPEQFNSVTAKHLGGKRVNFCTAGSYEARTEASVISFNTGRLVTEVRKVVFNEPEENKNTIIYNIESKRLKRREKSVRPSYLRKVCLPDKNYGTDSCQRPDMSPEVFEMLKNVYMDSLKQLQKDRIQIQHDTTGQANDNYREQIQEDILTASSFGKICKATENTHHPSLVKNIRYASSETTGNTKNIKHGKIFEHTAIQHLSEALNIEIKNCGIFIDQDCEFLGACPTGLIGENGIVILKCPSSAYSMDINEAIVKRKVTFWSMSRKRKNQEAEPQIVGINKNHEWYFEIQGMLHITKREFCIFAVWSGHEEGTKCIKHETINYDISFWKTRMEVKLLNFFNLELLPEIVDPRKERSMPIRGAAETAASDNEADGNDLEEED